jgi:hypothetical protein
LECQPVLPSVQSHDLVARTHPERRGTPEDMEGFVLYRQNHLIRLHLL